MLHQTEILIIRLKIFYTRTSPAGHGGASAVRSHRQRASKCKIRTQNEKNHKLLEIFCKYENIKTFGTGNVGDDFFRAARLRAVPAFRPSLLLGKGFALLPFKNGVDIAAVEGVAASIDRHGVPKGQECTCHDPRTGGGVLAPRRDVRGSKN